MAKLLIVDDDKGMLELYEGFCASYHHPFESTDSPVRALKLTLEHTFDVILTDFNMPVWSGLTLALKIRSYEVAAAMKRTPILCITGVPEDVERMNRRDRSPIDLIMCKGSFKMSELDEVIRKLAQPAKVKGEHA